jgi:hypothetical protein
MPTLGGANGEYDLNGWYVENNIWDSSVLGLGYVLNGTYNALNPTSGLKYSWNFGALPDDGYYWVHAFPNVGFGQDAWSTGLPAEAKPFPLSIASLSKYLVNYDLSFGGVTDGYNVAFEMYLTSSPGGGAQSITNEVMVWVHNGGWDPAGAPVGSFSDANYSGQIYSYPIYESGVHANYTAILTDTDDPSGTIDLKAIMQKLKTLGIITGNEYISNIQLGAEVAAGQGSLAINKLQLDIQPGGAAEVLIDGSGITPVNTPSPGTGSGSGAGEVPDSGSGSPGKGLAAGVLANDFNADGRSDVVWVNEAGQAMVWTMNGASRLSGSSVLGSASATLGVVTAADFTGDGKPDLLAQDENGQPTIWSMNGLTRIGTASPGFNPGSSWQVIDAGDFDGDRIADILWRDEASGAAKIWLMDDTDVKWATSFASPGTTWSITGSGDFDGDGKSDLAWQNSATGQVQVWTMDGVTVASKTTLSPTPGSNWRMVDSGDFNDDGNADILLQNADGTVRIWEMNGASILAGSDLSGNPGAGWRAVGARDFNGDGKDDILFQNTGGQTMIWAMNGFVVQSKTALAGAGSSWHAVV